MSAGDLRDGVEALRDEVGRAGGEIARASAVLTLLESAADRTARGTDAGDAPPAARAFRRYLQGEDRPGSLSYLTGQHVRLESGTSTAFDAPRDPSTSAVDGLVRDLQTHVGGGAVDAATLGDDFAALVENGTAEDLRALVALFEHVVAAARGYRDDRRAALNGTGGDGGQLQSFLDSVDDEANLLDDDPMALLPVRLETRFVFPNDDSSPRTRERSDYRLPDFNRTDPGQQELRIRVYPDQVHVDSHEAELTVQEDQWGRTFWAQVWFACQPPTARTVTENGQQRTRYTHDYDRGKVPDDLEPVLDDLEADWEERFGTEPAPFYRNIKERAWNQLVERFGRERGAYIVHATSPTAKASEMLAGYDDADPFADGVPTLTFPEVDLRPGSWSQPPVASLLPDRWIAIGRWRRVDEDEGEDVTREVRIEGDAIEQPLPIGPSPEHVGSEDLAETPGEAPPGMEWMTDWSAAKDAGMGLTVTAEDLNGTDPGEAIFEELLVVGVRASQSGEATTGDLESLFDAHHYTDGLELLDRGTPTNNSTAESAGYSPKDDPEESVRHECGPPLSTFGDFTDGDLLSRALGIAAPGDGQDHVFAHIEGADGRSQADARHMNSLLWSGTIGYYLRNLLVDNRWTNRDSIWEDYDGDDGGTAKSFPIDPELELGETLKALDAWRRHFVRYVRAGGPFPPLRIGTVPYGVLPAQPLPDEEAVTPGLGVGGDFAERFRGRDSQVDFSDQVVTPDGSYQLDTSNVQLADEATGGTYTTEHEKGTETTRHTKHEKDTKSTRHTKHEKDDPATTPEETPSKTDATKKGDFSVGRVSRSGYSVTVPESTTQVESDLYGSSFDPAVPRKSKSALRKSSRRFQPDGGSGVATRTRERAFRRDDEFPGRLQSWLEKLTGAWDDSTGSVDRVGSPEGSDLVDRILGREANADDFVRERFTGYDALAAQPGINQQGLDTLSEYTTRKVREMLIANDMTDLDPRLAWMLPPMNLFGSGSTSDRPVDVVTDGHEPAYLQYLYDEDIEFLQRMGWPVGLDHVTVDKERVKQATGWGSEIDSLTEPELFMHIVLTNPEHGMLRKMLWGEYSGTILPDLDQDNDELYANVGKLQNVYFTDGHSLQNTLFKQLTRFSVLQGYVGGRIRLGLKWDDLDIESENAFLSPDRDPRAPSAEEVEEIEEETGRENVRAPDYTQQPVPDPSVHGPDTKSAWDWLDEEVPEAKQLDGSPTTYAEILHKTGSPSFDYGTVDPRMREVFDAAAYLEDRDADTVGRLFTETLDLASHRLDAWWTSLATRRLFEMRETEEADFYDGAEFAFVGDHFERGEDTETAPDLGSDSSGGSGYSVVGNTAFGRVENHSTLVRDYGSIDSGYTVVGSDDSTDEPATDGGETDTDAETAATESPAEPATRESGDEPAPTERTGERSGGEPTESPAHDAPVTYVGAYGYVQDLHADTLDDQLETKNSAGGGTEAEYIHAPSPQHAATAAILRSGRRNHSGATDDFEEGDLAELLDIDLSPGRVRAARQVLDGVRQGQMLGDLLGYRFERRLLERSKSYNESHGDSIVLPKYKFALRQAFPGKEGQLDHGGGEGSADLDVGTAAAASDVLDGYTLYTTWQEHVAENDEDGFFGDIEYDGENASTLLGAMSGAERSAMEALLEEIEAIVDAVTDLLIAENVHQLGKGNFERAGSGIDDLVKGKPVADPEVTQTPRNDVGVTHRLGVTFGDPSTASVRPEWQPDTAVVSPDSLPSSGRSSTMPATTDTPLTLQPRADAEPNLDAWFGDLLPDPARVSCRASLTWDATREFASGTFATPTDTGVVTVDDLDFQPDLVVFGLVHGVPNGGETGPATQYGFTNGLALRGADGVEQVSTSVGTDFAGSDAGGYVSESHAIHAHLHDADDAHGELRGGVRFLDDGFDVTFDSVAPVGPAGDGLVVTYRAYSFANRSNVEVGTFTTGTDTVPLGVVADEVRLFGTTVATGAGTPLSTTGAAGFSQGMAVATDAGIHQHALGASVDPSSGGHVAGVRDDRALHLPFAAGTSAAGTTSVSVTDLGSAMDLSYASTHAGDAGDASRVVAYVAIGSGEEVETPDLGVVDRSRSAGDTETITTGFRPGAVELVALPEDAGTNADGGVTTGGLAQGVATGLGEQHVLHHAVRDDGDGGGVSHGAETGGDGVELATLAADGTLGDPEVARVTSLSDDGFTLTFPSVDDGSGSILWRAWPEAPESVTHVADSGVSLADLDLSPLDAASLTQQNRKAGDSQLERRMGYHLARNPPDHEPPVPADATVELEFDTPAPATQSADPLSVGAFLEVAAGLRDLVGESRPMDAGDLEHPGEADGAGHTDATVTELQSRADAAHDRLGATGRVLDNRVGLLDPADDDEEAITTQVDRLHDTLRAFTRDTPFDGLTTAAETVDSALSANPDALTDALRDLREHMPAGVTDRDRRSFDFAVSPAPAQDIELDTKAPNTTLDVAVWSTSPAAWFSKTDSVGTDGDGNATVTFDFSAQRPGSGFVVVVSDGTTVLDVHRGCVLVPAGASAVDADADQYVDVTAGVTETTVQVTVTPVGAAGPIASTQVETGPFGDFTVSFDASGHGPFTVFEIEASDGGTTVAQEAAYVRPDPAGVVEANPVLAAALWIDDRADAFDPYGVSPTAALDTAVREGTDWDTVRAELATLRDLNGKTGGGESGTPPQSAIDAVASCVQEGDEAALEALDLTAVDAAVDAVSRVVDAFGLSAMFDVTGRPDRAGGIGFWPVSDALADEHRQARFETALADPERAVSGDPTRGFTPPLDDLLGEDLALVYPRGDEDVEQLVAYLRAFAAFLPRVVDDPALNATLADPEVFVRGFVAMCYHPEAMPTGTERSTFLADFRRFLRQPVLGGIADVDEPLEAADAEDPYYNLDTRLLDTGAAPGEDTEAGRFEREFSKRLEAVRDDLSDELDRGGPAWDVGLAADEPGHTPSGTPVTHARFLLEGFRIELLPALLQDIDARAGTGTSAGGTDFSTPFTDRLSTLATVVDEQEANLSAGRNAGAFDDALREGMLETLRRALLRASYFGVYGSVPRSPVGGSPEDERTLVTQARTAMEEVRTRYRTADTTGSGDTSVQEQVARLEAIFGEDFDVLPTFEPGNAAELTATFGRSVALQDGDPMAAETWFQRIARVRDETANFRRALSYTETVTGRRHRDLQVGQLPHRPDERWVGLPDQEPEPGRLSLVLQHGAGFTGDYTGGPVAGLFVDELVENVPTGTETTGVAMQYDDPDATAPNSILLALPPEDGDWSIDHVAEVVTDTMELARYRMVDLEDLDEFGTLLPMLSFPQNDRVKPDAPSVDVDRIERFHETAPEWWQLTQRIEYQMPAEVYLADFDEAGTDGGGN